MDAAATSKSQAKGRKTLKKVVVAGRSAKSGKFLVQDNVGAVFQAAKQSGLLAGKDGRIGSRISAVLISKAKARTGIESDTQLIEFALASLALEDNFAHAFRKVRGKVDPALTLEF